MALRQDRGATRETPRKGPARTIGLVLVSALVFAGILIVRLPASWVIGRVGHGVACSSASGSIWDGYCSELRVSGTSFGQVTWQVQPASLLSGRLAAHLTMMRGNAQARADAAVTWNGTVTARDLTADLPLDSTLMAVLPPAVAGTLHLALRRIEVTRTGVIRRLRGRIEVHNLVDSSGQVTPLGSFEVTFPGGTGEPTGRLRDLGGPLWLEGTLRLTRQPGYDLHALVAARESAVPSLVTALEYLGSPDAEGRRPFALSGTY